MVEDFDGVSGKFDQVLSGTLDGTPALKDGKLSLKGKCTYTLDNVAMYHFKSFEIAASWMERKSGRRICCRIC